MDSITRDFGHPNYETTPSFKDLIGRLAKTGSARGYIFG